MDFLENILNMPLKDHYIFFLPDFLFQEFLTVGLIYSHFTDVDTEVQNSEVPCYDHE